ncbi:MAG: rod-binding protein [Spirochaetaceae bacterium]|jgi:flagellar protein FlgJ|nr:rod-binding protein [Spirochaetaceae bacterium]
MDIAGAAAFQLENGRYSLDSVAGIRDAALGRAGGGALFSEFLKADAPLADVKESAAARTPVKKALIDKGDKLYEQCEALEVFLIKTLINGMRKTVEKSGLTAGGFAGDMYEDILYDEYAKDFTRNAGFGLAELAYVELTGQRGKLLKGGGL